MGDGGSRCKKLIDGCRCLLDAGHRQDHVPSYTLWLDVVNLKRKHRGYPPLAKLSSEDDAVDADDREK